MNAQQKIEHREFYNQLRLALVDPGDWIADTRRPYEPVNKNDWTWDMAMSAPDTPLVARYRATRETSMWFRIGQVAQ